MRQKLSQRSIAIVTGPFLSIPPTDSGAVESRWLKVAEELAQRDWQVRLLCKKSPSYQETTHLGKLSIIPIRGFCNTGIMSQYIKDFIYSFRSLAQTHSCDIIISNTFWWPFLAKTLKQIKAPLMVGVARMPKGQYRIYRGVECYLCVSESVRQKLIEEQPLLNKNSKVLPNPINPCFHLNTNHAKKSYFTILYTGRVHRDKGLDLLLKSFLLCRDLCPNHDLRLVIIGPHEVSKGGSGKPYLDQLQAIAKSSPVQFISTITNKNELAKLYQSAQVFAYLSQDPGETFGVSPLEAMACGAVPFISNKACFKEFITHLENGFINEGQEESVESSAQNLRWLIEHPDQLKRMRKKGVEACQTYTVPAICDRLEHLLKDLLLPVAERK
jgi:glycosyltransferase involved in cell wall biosynthesis